MSDVQVGAKITVDTGNSETSIKGVTGALDKQAVSAKQAASANKEVTGGFSGLKEQLTQVPGAAGGAAEGISKLDKVFKILLANPVVLVIVAIVGALALLYKAFSSTFEGGQKMEQVFDGIKAAAQVVVDRLVMFGNAVIKFFSGDFKGALKDAKGAVTGIGDEIMRVYDQASKFREQIQKVDIAERAAAEDRAKRATKLALLREQLYDESIPIAKRKAAAEELRKQEEEDSKVELRLGKEKADAQIGLLTLKKDGAKKNAEEISKINISVSEAETAAALEKVRTNKVIRNLEKQDAAERHAEAEKHKKDLEELKKKEEELFKAYLKRKASRIESVVVSERELETELDKIRKEKDAKEKEAANAELERQKSLLNVKSGALIQESKERDEQRVTQQELDKKAAEDRIANINTVAGALNSLSDLLGQQTAVGKGLAIASSIINTWQGATKALAQGGIFGAIGAAGIVASGFSAVRKIISVQVPGASGSAATGDTSIPAAAPLTPQQQTTTINPAQIQQIGNAAVRSYVLDVDIQNNRERIIRINRAARLG